MAPKGKPLKNVRKTNPKLKLNQSNINTTQKATSSNRDNLEQNLRLPPKNELTYSAALRKNLVESLPVLPNSGFAEVSAVDEMSNPKGKMIPSIAGQPREYARIELDMSLFNIPHNNRAILPKPSSSFLTNARLIPELYPNIKHCPMCNLLFPQDWSQQKINYHVFAHFDKDFNFATHCQYERSELMKPIFRENLEQTQNKVSTTQKTTSSNRDNLEQNLRLPLKNELTYSAALRKNLVEFLPVLPNSGVAEVSAVDEMSNPKGKMIPSLASQPREYARIELDLTSINIPYNNRTNLPKPSSTLLTNDQLIPEVNPDIKHCPMCDLLFPQDWSNQKINYHVFAHFDEDYKFATQNEWNEF